MKKLIVSLFALALMCTVSALAQDTMKSDNSKPAATSAKASKINGWVSDSKCGAAGAKAGHADCMKKCTDAGEKVVFVSDKDKSVWSVDNPEELKGHEGHHVRVTAHVDKTNNSIHVASVKMLSQGKAKKDSMSEMHDKS